jgi:hypothetical protein
LAAPPPPPRALALLISSPPPVSNKLLEYEPKAQTFSVPGTDMNIDSKTGIVFFMFIMLSS